MERRGVAIAGIGWKLERMLEREGLGATAGAYAHGLAATSTPWLMTVGLLGGLRIIFGSDAAVSRIEEGVTVMYALTIVLSAPLHVVLSRFIADRIYESRLGQIAGPLMRALATTLIVGAVAGCLLTRPSLPPLFLAMRAPLAAVTTAQWLLVSVVAGMCTTHTFLTVYGIAGIAGLSVALGSHLLGVDGGAAYLASFAIAQLTTVLLLLRALLRALPEVAEEDAALLPAFIEYWKLALAALFSYAAIWTDKLVVWRHLGADAALSYSAATSWAWFSVLPASALVFVRVETRFYRRFSEFFSALLGGATREELGEGVARLREEVRSLLSELALVQSMVTLTALTWAPEWMAWLHLPLARLAEVRLLLLGAGLQQVMLCALLVLYYFDRRGEALQLALIGCGASSGATWVAVTLHACPAWGYLFGAALTSLVAVLQAAMTTRHLLVDTFQGQPYGVVLQR